MNGLSVGLTYDADDLIVGAGALTLSRSAQNGLITGTALGNVRDTWTYDAFAAPIGYNASFNTTAIFAEALTRDKAGRITQKSETIGGATSTFSYNYDPSGRLVSVSRNGVVVSTYAYDVNGNRSSITTSGGTINGAYDNQDRLVQYGPTAYTYTANGDLATRTISTQTTRYTYDALGNLTTVALPDGRSLTYLVDGRNRRIGKLVNGVLAKGYLYQDGLKPIAEVDGNSTVISRFVYASRINVPEYMIKGGVIYRIVVDHLGSPRLVVDVASGSVAQRLDYDEFGSVLTDTNPGFQPFGFAGGLYDQDTKLVRFGARDYDATNGRWTAKDPLLFAAGVANLYTYALNDPVSVSDPTGRLGPIAVAIAVGVIGGVANAVNAYTNGVTSVGGLAEAFGVGAVSSLVGLVAGAATENPYIGGAVSGAITTAGNRYILGVTNADNPRADFAIGTIGGALCGGLPSGLASTPLGEAAIGGVGASGANAVVNFVNAFLNALEGSHLNPPQPIDSE